MKTIKQSWSRLGISRKFSLAFSMLLLLMLLIALTAYFSFLSIHRAGEDIRISTVIGQQVLEMDRGMEKARRLLGDFFIHYQTIGLQEAHEQYAQPSVRQIARVISISKNLNNMFSRSELNIQQTLDQVDINLYLASAKRFADTSIEAVELISQRAAPDRGLEAQLQVAATSLKNELNGFPVLQKLESRVHSFYKDYLISRQRSSMQSAFNVQSELRDAADREAGLQTEQKTSIFSLLDSCHQLADELLVVDLEIAGKLLDFSLQEQTVIPVSNALVGASMTAVAQAQQRIDQVHHLAGIIILTIVLIGIMAMITVDRLLRNTITKNILNLSVSAAAFGKGNLEAQAREESQDELGKLARIFNTMASQIKDLMENLEQKVVQRTAELAESETRFRNLVNNLPMIAVQGCDEERNVIYWNRTCETMYGYSEKEAIDRKLEDLIVPESMKEGVIHAIRNWYENGVAIPSSELTLHHKDGSDVPVYCTPVMQVSSQGKKTIFCVDVDLADLKLAQAMEQKSEAFYRQLFDHSSSGVAVFEAVDNGRDFIFKDFNKAAEEMEKISRDELLGRRVTEVFPGIDEFGLLDVFRRVWQTGEAAQHPVTMYKDSRLQGWRENSVYKLPTGEVISVYEDITEQKQLEEEKLAMEERLQQAQKMQAIGTLAGGIAHDFNNILSAIIGYAELIEHEVPEESRIGKDIAEVLISGKRAADLVKQILTFSRKADSDKMPLRPHLVVKEALKMLRATLPTTVHIEEDIDPDCGTIIADPTNIHQVTINLCTNALHAMEDGKGVLNVSLQRRELNTTEIPQEQNISAGPFVILSVSDTGCGLDKDAIDHIFEPYFTTKEVGSGSGLGLAVVHGIVRDCTGFIEVESRVGKGSTFSIYLPVTEEPAVQPAVSDQKNRAATTAGRKRILVVDDELLLVKINKKRLESRGYLVTAVSDSREALKKFRDQPDTFDLLITDQTMPELTGAELAKAVLEIKPSLPIIMCTGHSDTVPEKKALSIGIKKYVFKPVQRDELLDAVREVLNQK